MGFGLRQVLLPPGHDREHARRCRQNQQGHKPRHQLPETRRVRVRFSASWRSLSRCTSSSKPTPKSLAITRNFSRCSLSPWALALNEASGGRYPAHLRRWAPPVLPDPNSHPPPADDAMPPGSIPKPGQSLYLARPVFLRLAIHDDGQNTVLPPQSLKLQHLLVHPDGSQPRVANRSPPSSGIGSGPRGWPCRGRLWWGAPSHPESRGIVARAPALHNGLAGGPMPQGPSRTSSCQQSPQAFRSPCGCPGDCS